MLKKQNLSLLILVFFLLTAAMAYAQQDEVKKEEKKSEEKKSEEKKTEEKKGTEKMTEKKDEAKKYDLPKGTYAEMKTSMGTVVFEIYEEKVPNAAANFIGLAEGTKEWTDPKSGEKVKKPFYDGLTFHRVIDGFMIQGGCPLGTGTGSPGYKFADEIVGLKHDKEGVVAYANSGPNTNGCQFYITVVPTPHLDRGYTIFGQVVKGMDVVHKIAKVKTGMRDKPVEPVTIEKVSIIRVK